MGLIIKKKQEPEAAARAVNAEHYYSSAAEIMRNALCKKKILQESKNDLLELSLKIAEKIAGESVKMSPSDLDRIYRNELSSVSGFAPGTLFVNAQDLLSSETKKFAESINFKIAEDSSLENGECIIEAEGVRVDTTVKSLLYLYKKVLIGG